jgi:transketolase
MSKDMHLLDVRSKELKHEAIRKGFGRGLVEAGKANEDVVALCADLTGSTVINLFAEAFPERFVEVGIAEQNLVTVASGMAAMGKIPFTSSYAAFSPGRNWEQYKTTACINNRPVKIVGSHAGLMTGPDGATHQMLEDIALMRTLPNNVVVVPCDSVEAEKATRAIARNTHPCYIRIARADTPVFTTVDTPFEIGKAYVFSPGRDVTICATGTMVYQALVAAEELFDEGIDAEVINVPTIKPLDAVTIVQSAVKTGAVISVEEAQINGGLGSAVAEVLGEQCPVPLKRLGVRDRFGETGKPQELLEHFGLTAEHIAAAAREITKRK